MTEERIQRIQRVVSQRTYNVVPVVEGLYDMGNLAACCRSADAFGLGAVHAVNRRQVLAMLMQLLAVPEAGC
jgi:tRNA G18 (ribose-2'-O)-methylase SpoU